MVFVVSEPSEVSPIGPILGVIAGLIIVVLIIAYVFYKRLNASQRMFSSPSLPLCHLPSNAVHVCVRFVTFLQTLFVYPEVLARSW